jgi:hypothetical protein
MTFPSADDLVKEAAAAKPKDLNALHYKTYLLMMKHKERYYEEKVDAFFIYHKFERTRTFRTKETNVVAY